MYFNKNVRLIHATLIFLLLALVAGTAPLQAQTKQILTWQQDLDYLGTLADEDLPAYQGSIEQIRQGVALWIEMHPSTEIELPAAPDKPWGNRELRSQVTVLSQAVESILSEDPNRPFQLGSTAVSVTAEASPLSPVTDTFDNTEIRNLNATTVDSALNYLPGLTLDHSANRNEVRVFLRGFDNIGRVPLYLDGIPIQVPYDGVIDLSRFQTNDIAEIQVAKGYSSPLLGANNLGGSINLVTRKPEKPFEADAVIGTGSGEMLQSGLQLGTKWDKFYIQGSVDWLQKEYVPLSGDFPLDDVINQTNYELNNSDSRDAKYSGRIAYTPKGRDSYVFSVTNQKGEKSQPFYVGENDGARTRYWHWPFWNKYSYYFLSNTELSDTTSFKLRLFYDQFKNGLSSFDDDTYTEMTRRYAFYSVYDDHTSGFSAEVTTRVIPYNAFSASFSFKDDVHKNYGFNPTSPNPDQPETLDEIQTLSIGFQDVITFTPKFRATFGFSADHLNGIQTQPLNDDKDAIVPLQCEADPDNMSFTGCTPNEWTYNPQVSLSYNVTERSTLFVTFADRGRFPMMKEFYTMGIGTRLPSPDLEPERSRNWNVGYSYAFASQTLAQVEYFHSTIRDAINDVYVVDPGPVDNPVCWDSDNEGYCERFANVTEEVHQGFELSLRSTLMQRLTVDASWSYINRTIEYDPDVQRLDPEALILPTLPRNKVFLNATVELPHEILALFTFRHEGGLELQDTTYGSGDTGYIPFAASHSVVDLGTVAPLAKGFSLQAGLKNLLDSNYYYTPGYPEAGRNWYFNMRYRF
jgi:iron complex outermembrane receptor protein